MSGRDPRNQVNPAFAGLAIIGALVLAYGVCNWTEAPAAYSATALIGVALLAFAGWLILRERTVRDILDRRCPSCGYPNKLGWTNCFKCGKPRPEPDPTPPPVVQTTRQRRGLGIGPVLAVCLCAYLVFISVQQWNDAERDIQAVRDATAHPQTHTCCVTYEVTGTARSVSVTYQNGDGGTQQESDRAVPWRRSFVMSTGDFVYISAQNQGEYGTVTVTIRVGDHVAKTSTSSGAYVIADASGTL